jgi:hypothetical protein
MGEAKRRKQLDPTWGKQPKQVFNQNQKTTQKKIRFSSYELKRLQETALELEELEDIAEAQPYRRPECFERRLRIVAERIKILGLENDPRYQKH